MFSNQSRGIFGGPPEPPQNVEIPPRKTKLYSDLSGPWSQSPEIIKNLFSAEDQKNDTFKFPKSLDNVLTINTTK